MVILRFKNISNCRNLTCRKYMFLYIWFIKLSKLFLLLLEKLRLAVLVVMLISLNTLYDELS